MTQPSWIGHNLGGRYLIDSELGQGGMSAVYRATDANLRRVVAVKLIHSHLSRDQEFVRRFEAEATSVAQLRHPNIVQVYDFNHEGDTYFIVFEFVPGETLQARLKRFTDAGRRLPFTEVFNISDGIGSALEYAHKRDIVHRDIKPANVMINVNEEPILTDFGIVKIVGGPQHTATGAVVGTARYMSPEQIKGVTVDARSDIYSFGIMMYEMVAGLPPFSADSAMTVMMMHVSEPVPDLKEIRADVPVGLVRVINRALAKDPESRYQTMTHLLADLRLAHVGEETAVAPPPPPPPQQVHEVERTEILDPEKESEAPEPPQIPVSKQPSQKIPAKRQISKEPVRPATQAPQDRTQDKPPTKAPSRQPAKSEVTPPPQTPPMRQPQLERPPEIGTSQKTGPNMALIGGIAGVVVIAIILLIVFNPFGGGDDVEPTTVAVASTAPTEVLAEAIATDLPTPTAQVEPTEVLDAPTSTPTVAPTDTPTPSPTPTETPIPVPEGMIQIPSGSFLMGSNDGRADEAPEHTVSISSFVIDQFEVSNADYSECVAAGACGQIRSGSFTRTNYRDNPEFANHPAIGVTWNQAVAYCTFREKRLPTEAEWEYAASGTENLTWPWGNSFDPALSAASARDTQAVDSFPDGRSPFGVFNMAGNVVEWVQDNYSTTFTRCLTMVVLTVSSEGVVSPTQTVTHIVPRGVLVRPPVLAMSILVSAVPPIYRKLTQD